MGGSLRGHAQPAERLHRRAEHRARLRHDARSGDADVQHRRTSRARPARNLTEARQLYALLTGRVTSIAGTARLDAATGKYVYNGDLAQQVAAGQLRGCSSQDSWRVDADPDAERRPALGRAAAVHAGRQHVVDGDASRTSAASPASATASAAAPCNMFQPGRAGGQADPDVSSGSSRATRRYKTNWNNFAPNVGVAWRPERAGRLAADAARRSGAGDDPRRLLDELQPGAHRPLHGQRRQQPRRHHRGDPQPRRTGFPLVLPGESLPVLLSQTSRLGPPAFPDDAGLSDRRRRRRTASTSSRTDLRTPRVHSYSVGRPALDRPDMALEVRYVGNKNKYTWAEENWNERSIFDERLLRRVQAGAGQPRGQHRRRAGAATFAYTGRAGHVAAADPPGLFERQLRTPSNPAAYTSTNFTNSAFVDRFSTYEPQVRSARPRCARHDATFRANALTAGLPRNFFVHEPARARRHFVVQDKNWTKYNSLQVDLRRRLSQGLLVSAQLHLRHPQGARRSRRCAYRPHLRSTTPTCRTRSR